MGTIDVSVSETTKTASVSYADFSVDPFGSHTGQSSSVTNSDLLLDNLLNYDNSSSTVNSAPLRTAPPVPASFDPFGDDPFGGDPFAAKPNPVSQVRLAPPLTPAQVEQHKQWFQRAIAAGGGLLYDDNTLQVSTKIEIRGSQCRFTLNYANQSPGIISDLSVEVKDTAGLMRFEISPLPSSTISGNINCNFL
jgi:hypothetical protein